MATFTKNKLEPELISYNRLRRIIGILGITFPLVMIIGTVCINGCMEIQGSISIYYHTAMRNIFVGFLCAIALFLYTYQGYEAVDNIVSNLAGLFALGLAFIPTTTEEPLTTCIPNRFDHPVIGAIHYVCAGGFLLSLAFFSLYLFRKKDKRLAPTAEKDSRNRLYLVMGIIMLVCMALIVVYLLTDPPALKRFRPVFWLETVALTCFGISWFIKGRTLLTDEEEPPKPAVQYHPSGYHTS